ncbi:GatB/YqeY [Candidatus Saccharibacteria bacterium]|nr:GatB/YqeY [Candidatus Saccharibacteria bacterium]NCU40549.1 GatB/YqeY [Candidatus Saccharibacteria bacterium]
MANLKERIQADLKSAMLARDSLKTVTLQGLKAVILNEEVAKNVRDTGLDDIRIEQLIAREIKKRDEAAEMYEQGLNQQSAEKERAEKQILSVYLPDQLGESEIQDIVDSVITELNSEGIKDMGRVIATVKNKTGNKADGAVVAKLVKKRLQ